ncbi:hypothetical protein NBH00_06195 [Paraconexibacter antarcticus]|uniref:Uncharacterized protein n=1 Tax=Paraconexibacter antarcticus TaxID=2949664 RepID=A0ABY5DWY0_9ACTN|nr:hypothetical protein [Paraconexibacter antarcticus]UTI65803.1 hypothetical protein NBH00_06195 [Paraconexibacter antarcticus]
MTAADDIDPAEAQRRAEAAIRSAAATALGVPLEPRTMALPGGATADVDGVDAAQTVFAELFARRGRLKGPQLDKVARDALKLTTLARAYAHPAPPRLVIAFADEAAAASVTGGSWLAEALRTWGIEVLVVDAGPA